MTSGLIVQARSLPREEAPNPHKVLAVKRKQFPRPRGFGVLLTPFSPRSRQRRRRPSVGDPACLSRAGAAPGPGPGTSRTQHAGGLRRPPSSERGGCAGGEVPAGPDTRSFPGPRPFGKRQAHLRQGRGQLGKARGRGGSSGDCCSSGPRFGGGREDSGMAPRRQARTTGDGLAPISFRPPTRPRTAARSWTAAVTKAGAAGVPSNRRAAGAAAEDMPGRARGPVTIACHRCGWPQGRPFGVGSPAAPRPQRLAKRLTSKTSLVWSMW